MEPGFRYGRRKYHPSCRARIQHESNVRRARRNGCQSERKWPFWVWFAEYRRYWTLEMQCDPPEPVAQPLVIAFPAPYSMKRKPAREL
jgi:hypothetical protein